MVDFAEMSGCERCELASTRQRVVIGSGPLDAELMIVGEAPGRTEDEGGAPFIGQSGKLFFTLLEEEVGRSREECYVTNVVKCRPPANRTPTPHEIATCRPWLVEQLDRIAPRLILTLGNTAGRAIFSYEAGIGRVHGQVFDSGRHSRNSHVPPRGCAARRAARRCDHARGSASAARTFGGIVSWRRYCASAGDTQVAGEEFALLLSPGDIVLLAGQLGAGKTTFIQGVARGLGVDERVTSPTFTMVREHRCVNDLGIATLHHADVYRVGSLAEVSDLALGELVEEAAVALIEWGDIAAPLFGHEVLSITFNLDEREGRTLVVEGGLSVGRERALEQWANQ